MRSRLARTARAHRSRRRSASESSPVDPLKPGCAARSPGFLFCTPRWRNRNTRMPQKHVSPGSYPGWGTRFVCASECARACSFTTWMWQRRPRRALAMPIERAAGWRGFPSSNGKDGGLSSRQCRFNSGRERQYSSHLAVAQRPAHVARDDEIVGSTPAGETSLFPSSSVDQRARGYDPRGRGFESLPGCQQWRRISEQRVPACRAGVRGFKVPPAPPMICRVAFGGADLHVPARSSMRRAAGS
jgi:hypothetical protein